MKYPVQFGLINGSGSTITDVCSDPSEPEWVLNIKKGFISSLQSLVTMPSELGKNITEVNIS